MTPMTYPATITQAPEGDFVVRFRDVPEALTGAATRAEALALAADALAVALEGYLEAGQPFPVSSSARVDEIEVAVDPALAARAMLIAAMAEQRLSNVALAQRLGKDEKAIRRIVSGRSASFALTLAALRAAGLGRLKRRSAGALAAYAAMTEIRPAGRARGLFRMTISTS